MQENGHKSIQVRGRESWKRLPATGQRWLQQTLERSPWGSMLPSQGGRGREGKGWHEIRGLAGNHHGSRDRQARATGSTGWGRAPGPPGLGLPSEAVTEAVLGAATVRWQRQLLTLGLPLPAASRSGLLGRTISWKDREGGIRYGKPELKQGGGWRLQVSLRDHQGLNTCQRRLYSRDGRTQLWKGNKILDKCCCYKINFFQVKPLFFILYLLAITYDLQNWWLDKWHMFFKNSLPWIYEYFALLLLSCCR